MSSTRRQFIQASAAASAGIIAANLPEAAATEGSRTMDQLTDASGKYAVAALPFAYDAARV